MDKGILVAMIIGLLIFSIGAVSKSEAFTQSQKPLLYITLVVFFPLGLALTGILYLLNRYK